MIEFADRITGTELEWGICIPDPADPEKALQLESEQIDPYVMKYLSGVPHAQDFDIGLFNMEYEDEVEADAKKSQVFLGNGGRFYGDCGDHREYATPEDRSYLGTTANEIAGERIMESVAEHVSATYPVYELNKQVVGDDGGTWGYHESYCVDAKVLEIKPDALALHGVHLATRNIFFGAGVLLVDGSFALSQKTLDVTRDYSTSTLSKKAVVNLRDEPLADKSRFRRVHVTSGDPNMSPWATRLKLGTTSLVLRLIEHGETLDELRFQDGIARVSRGVLKDLSLSRQYRLKGSQLVTAAEVQRYLCLSVRKNSAKLNLSSEDQWTLDEWERACADAIQNPALLENRVDWLMRYRSVMRHQKKTGHSRDSNELLTRDRQFSRIGATGIGLMLRQSVWQEWMPSESLIRERILSAPKNTRAHIRGNFIKAFSGTGANIGAAWEAVYINQLMYSMMDPYQNTHPLIDKRIATRL